jgi:transcriptional regulator of heat shock response
MSFVTYRSLKKKGYIVWGKKYSGKHRFFIRITDHQVSGVVIYDRNHVFKDQDHISILFFHPHSPWTNDREMNELWNFFKQEIINSTVLSVTVRYTSQEYKKFWEKHGFLDTGFDQVMEYRKDKIDINNILWCF